MTTSEKQEIRKLQATLTKISLNTPTFFNIVQFKDKMGLVKEHGKNSNGTTKWILTEKGRRILNFHI